MVAVKEPQKSTLIYTALIEPFTAATPFLRRDVQKTFEYDCILEVTDEQWEWLAKVGHNRFTDTTENNKEVLPFTTFERFVEFLREQTDLLEEHTREYWNTVPRWKWNG